MAEQEKKSGMREIFIEKMILSCAGTADKLDKSVKLLKSLSGMKPLRTKSSKRIPNFSVRPGLETGCKVTIRGEKIIPLLKRLFEAVKNEIREKQIKENHFSFGVPEYIEIPDMEYDREIGILGLNVTIDFARKGKRVARKKIKPGKPGKKQIVSKEEIIEFVESLGVNIKRRRVE